MKIICDGDSWVFGCEIVSPHISARYSKDTHPGAYDYVEENDLYRLPKIFPSWLSRMFKAEVVNLSWPADSNGTILNRTLNYLGQELRAGTSPEELFVIVGWSSPERNFFWYKDDDISHRFTLWPQVRYFDAKPQETIWDYYVTYLWHPEEYMPRYTMNVLQLQNFCNQHGIKWMCFNSFYQTPKKSIEQWQDLNVRDELTEIMKTMHSYCKISTTDFKRNAGHYDYTALWDTVDPIRFYKKDQSNSTFKSFITNSGIAQPFNGWHPSPEGHEIWAKELYRYINENNLL